MFLINSRSAVFTAPHSLAAWGGHLANLRPVVLQSSLRIVLSIVFVYSTRPPVLVCSTDSLHPFTSIFLKTENFHFNLFLISIRFATQLCTMHLAMHGIPCPKRHGTEADFPTSTTLLLKPGYTWLDIPILSTLKAFYPVLKGKLSLIGTKKYRNFNLLSIGYANFVSLTLGPTYPTLINIESETLGFRRYCFSQ